MDFEIILAGGGLANGIIALSLAQRRPELRFAIIDAADRLGGEHTWSFHGSDLTEDGARLLQPLLHSSWAAQDVAFPRLSRTLSTSYHTLTSDTFHRHLASRLASDSLLLGRRIEKVATDHVVLDGGRTLTARCVIDGRGWQAEAAAHLALAYQKFVGLEIETLAPHGLRRPVIMDATVAQIDGYRFVYCLPYTETSLLVEDTYYSEDRDLDRGLLAERIHKYAASRGWQVRQVVREEQGVLPIVLAGTPEAFGLDDAAMPRVGLRGGLFHPTTGYSVPDAVRVAEAISQLPEVSSAAVARLVRDLSMQAWQDRGFYRLLNRLLFIAAAGDVRRDVMQRFYRLPRDLIERFYAGRTTTFDKVRILSGRPPVPLGRAVGALPVSAAWRFTDADDRAMGGGT